MVPPGTWWWVRTVARGGALIDRCGCLPRGGGQPGLPVADSDNVRAGRAAVGGKWSFGHALLLHAGPASPVRPKQGAVGTADYPDGVSSAGPAGTDAPAGGPPAAGFLVALEGGDGSGKTTQQRLLAGWLAQRGHEVVATREPGGTATGLALRQVLLAPAPGAALAPRAEALLFAADRAQHVAEVVRPALARGAVVVTDRYVDSSLAYQGAGRALPAAEVEELSRWATGGLVPGLTVVLDVDPATAAGRRGRDAGRPGEDRLEAESLAFHTRVREQFLDLAARAPARYLVLDAARPADAVQHRLREHLAPLLPVPSGPARAVAGRP
nr:dTMP kinase [Kineococcus siccus]